MSEKPKPCNVCGKSEFMNRDGYFFCVECGTQAENVRETAVEDEYLRVTQRASTRKVKSTKKDELDLTSWESVNYILVGLVNELNNLGAKDDLKLKAFQIWAEFLRRNEVAFFKSDSNIFPKLSASFKPRDAKVVYNHQILKRKRKKSESAGENSIAWRRQKKKFARSEYEKSFSETDQSLTSLFHSSFSSSDVSSTRGMKLTFTDSARKIIKKTVQPHHLKNHENDVLKEMDCKCIPIKKDTVLYRKRTQELFNRKTVYAILYLALNLINDDIQVSDLVRFIREGHLSSRRFENFFPENVRKLYAQLLSAYDFPKSFDQSGVSIRRQTAVICRMLQIKNINTPNMVNLTGRYCKDFMLPSEISLYVERLINFIPCEMKYISEETPFYEGRAIAYIIFVLKLLFGLDDIKEEIISESAKAANQFFNNFIEFGKLFVWTDWMKYIEIRKLILSRYSLCYYDSNKDFKNLNSYLNKLASERPQYNDDEIGLNRTSVFNMSYIFETFLKNSKRIQPSSTIQFITFTPQIDNFEKILYDPPEDIIITDMMKYDHSSTKIKPFLNPTEMKRNLKEKNINLNVFKVKGNEKLKYVETFSGNQRRLNENQIVLRKLKFVDDEAKKKKIVQKEKETNQAYSNILKIDFLKTVDEKKSTNGKNKNKKEVKISKNSSTIKKNLKLLKQKLEESYNNRSSTSVIDKSILSDLSDYDISESSDGDNVENHDSENLKFSISNMEYWVLYGKLNIKGEDFKDVKKHMPKNFLWLLQTFADYLETDLESIYHELMVVENYYLYKLDDIDKINNIILFKDLDKKETSSQFAEYYVKFW